MRVKFIDSNGTTFDNIVVLEISSFYLEDDTNKLLLNSDNCTFESVRTINVIDKPNFERWADSLLINGYVDLTAAGITFELKAD